MQRGDQHIVNYVVLYSWAILKELFNLNKRWEVNLESLQFGLSILHARMRIFESLLYVILNGK